MDSDSGIQLQRFQNDADSSPEVHQLMLLQNEADNTSLSLGGTEAIIQRNPKDDDAENQRLKDLAEENENAFHDAMIKNSAILSATLMLDLIGSCGIFIGSAMANSMQLRVL